MPLIRTPNLYVSLQQLVALPQIERLKLSKRDPSLRKSSAEPPCSIALLRYAIGWANIRPMRSELLTTAICTQVCTEVARRTPSTYQVWTERSVRRDQQYEQHQQSHESLANLIRPDCPTSLAAASERSYSPNRRAHDHVFACLYRFLEYATTVTNRIRTRISHSLTTRPRPP
jgi:hypothetical protein